MPCRKTCPSMLPPVRTPMPSCRGTCLDTHDARSLRSGREPAAEAATAGRLDRTAARTGRSGARAVAAAVRGGARDCASRPASRRACARACACDGHRRGCVRARVPADHGHVRARDARPGAERCRRPSGPRQRASAGCLRVRPARSPGPRRGRARRRTRKPVRTAPKVRWASRYKRRLSPYPVAPTESSAAACHWLGSGSRKAQARPVVAMAPSAPLNITTWPGSRPATAGDRVLSTPQHAVASTTASRPCIGAVPDPARSSTSAMPPAVSKAITTATRRPMASR